MPSELTSLIGNIIAQAPMVAIIAYLWVQDRKDKLKQIDFLRCMNKEKTEVMEKMVESMNKLALSLELIKDRLR